MGNDTSFIEVQFPVSKVSRESYTERKANHGQTLTGLGKWWGRKPLILVRAALLGLLMPASDNPQKDREVFLRILTMDDDGLWKRKSKPIPQAEIYSRLTPREREQWFETAAVKGPRLKRGLSAEQRQELQRLTFWRLTYDEKLAYCDRPEQVGGPSEESWAEINKHLGTRATSLEDLVRELGQRRFGHLPQVGDVFCGGGSIPFEAARMGCSVWASDLNPVATFMTQGALRLIGGSPETLNEVREFQDQVFDAVDRQVAAWGIEHNELGWRADNYLYCAEAVCPECGWKVPLASSWLIGEKTRAVAKLRPIASERRFEIDVISGVTDSELEDSRRNGSVRNSTLYCPNQACGQATPLHMLRGDRRVSGGTVSGLRQWEPSQFKPSPDDVYQERLYCIRWVETYIDEDGEERTRRYFRAPDEADRAREAKVEQLLSERFVEWQRKGYLPTRAIEDGYNTAQPPRERGWTNWHHLFNPRQLLVLGLLFKEIATQAGSSEAKLGALLSAGRCCDWNSKLSRWHPHAANEKSEQTFFNQALNTLVNYGVRTVSSLTTTFFSSLKNYPLYSQGTVRPVDARAVTCESDVWITDPPYADAVNYHELSEFFLAWYDERIPELFPDWYSDSKRALAITGSDETFRKTMADAYRNLTRLMPDDGMQIVMFTHQDVAVWADLALILWAAGLRVTAAWNVVTETDTSLRDGNYVQGTVLLILRKQNSEDTAFLDELYPKIEREVRSQIDSMLSIDDKDDPSFGDNDYQLAAYAASLRVLTQYASIEDFDVSKELAKTRRPNEESPIAEVIKQAVRIAAVHLVPTGFDRLLWRELNESERFYLKGLDLERKGDTRIGAYQELARSFGVRDYTSLLANTQANHARTKTPTEFGTRLLSGEGFSNALVRHLLFAVREVVRTGETHVGVNWLKTELATSYWNQRRVLIDILLYLSTLGLQAQMPQWREDAEGARLLAGALQNDSI